MSLLRQRVRPALDTVSAFFPSREAVDELLPRLVLAGVPRDLIEIVVTSEGAARFYGGKAYGPRLESARYAGIGGLIGLLLGIAISLSMIARPGFSSPGAAAIAQLIGPNFMTIGGAALGALIGAFVRRKPHPRHARVTSGRGDILLTVRARGPEQAAALLRLLSEAGGREARLDRESTT